MATQPHFCTKILDATADHPAVAEVDTPKSVNFFSEHWLDENGNPSGGVSSGPGITISWQNGPLGRGENRREQNGAFAETALGMILDRFHFFQTTKFACVENAAVIEHLERAIRVIQDRSQAREARGVEGTHQK